MSGELLDRLATALSPHYTVQRELGGGGMSRVFLATETALDRQVVVKLLPPELAHAVSADRFRQEIRLAARLSHPHIVPLLSAGHAGDLLYYTMPFVEGESLRARLARSGELPTREAVRLLREVADALAYAHDHGLVHRDIKPDNVLLSSGHAVVTDFGVAKALSASATGGDGGLTSLGVALGTPAYMAPEQAAAEPTTDHRADIYAWGCLAYEVLTGQPPFVGRTAQALLAAHAVEKPEPCAARRPALPPVLADLVMRCLAKRPADRPQTAGALVQALDGLATPSGGMEPTAVLPVRRPARRSVVLASGTLASVALVGGFAWAIGARTPPADGRRVALLPTATRTGGEALEPVAAMVTALIETGLAEIGSVDVVESPGGAGWIVRSALHGRGDSVQATAQIIDGATGKTVYTIGPEVGALADPRAAMERLAQRAIGGVALVVDSSHGVPGARPLRPPRWDAYREFLEGDASWYRERADSAATRFARSAELDTGFALARIRETVALLNSTTSALLGRADSLIAGLRERRGSLSPYEQSYLDLVESWARGDVEGRYQAAVRLSRLAPTSAFVAHLPGAFGLEARRYRAVVAALEPLDPTREALRNRRFFHLHLTRALHLLGEHERELRYARRARDMFPSNLVTCSLEARALAALGRTRELDSLLTDCLQLPAAVNSHRPLGSVLLWAEEDLRAHGHVEAATAVNTRLLAWLATRPPEEAKLPAVRSLRADALGGADRWPEAAALLDSLIGEYPDNLTYLGMRGVAAVRLGDSTGTRRWDERLLSLSNAQPGWVAGYRARIAAVRGDRERAVSLLRDAVSRGAVHALDHTDPALESLRGYPPYEDLIRPRE